MCYKLLLSDNSLCNTWLRCCPTEVTVHSACPWLRTFLFFLLVVSIWSQTWTRAGAWLSATRIWCWVLLGTDISYIYGCQNWTDIQRNSQLPSCRCFITPCFQLREQRKCLAKFYAVKYTFRYSWSTVLTKTHLFFLP